MTNCFGGHSLNYFYQMIIVFHGIVRNELHGFDHAFRRPLTFLEVSVQTEGTGQGIATELAHTLLWVGYFAFSQMLSHVNFLGKLASTVLAHVLNIE